MFKFISLFQILLILNQLISIYHCVSIKNKNVITVKNLNRVCGSNLVCDDELGLICKKGLCKCVDHSEWHFGLNFCAQTINTHCIPNDDDDDNDDRCDSSLGLACHHSLAVCLCKAGFHWSSISKDCVQVVANPSLLKKKIKNSLGKNQACISNVECEDDFGLVCKNGLCQCALNSVWNTKLKRCGIRLNGKCEPNNKEDSNDDLCDSTIGLICDRKLSICLCSHNKHWSNQFNKCISSISG